MTTRRPTKTALQVAATSLVLGAVAFALYRHVFASFWLFDDTYNLRYSIAHAADPWRFFFDPGVSRTISACYVTPWLALSYVLDVTLFGLDPFPFYVHQVVSLWIASVMLFAVLRLYLAWPFAALGGLLLLVSAPGAAVAEMLMTRHYVEGLLFSLAAVLAFTLALRKDSAGLSLVAGICCLLAATAKETFVPLPLLLIFLPEQNLRRRAVRAIPSLLGLFAYIVWRRWLLGEIVGGTGQTLPFANFTTAGGFGLLVENIAVTVKMITGVSTQHSATLGAVPVVACSVLILAASGILLGKKRFPPLLFFAAFLTTAYAVPLAAFNIADYQQTFVAYRVILVIGLSWIVATVAAAHVVHEAISELGRPLTRGVAHAVEFGLLLVVTVIVWSSSSAWIAEQRASIVKPAVAEGRFFMRAGRDVILRSTAPTFTTFYHQHLAYLRSLASTDPPPTVVSGPYGWLDAGGPEPPDGARIYEYQPATGAVGDTTASFLKERVAFRSRLRQAPLSARIVTGRGAIRWHLGPYTTGRYFALVGYTPGVYSAMTDVPLDLENRGATGMHALLRIGWESPEGWITLSPEWSVDFARDQEISWARD